MAGSYWLTILPETSRLKRGIKDAVREIDRGLSVSVTVDGAEREGRRFSERFSRSAKPKVSPNVNNAGVQRDGRVGGERYKAGFEETAEVKPEVDNTEAEAQGREYGERFNRGFGSAAAKIGASLVGIGLGFKLADGPAKNLLKQSGKIALGLKGAAIASGLLSTYLVRNGNLLQRLAGISLLPLSNGFRFLGDQAGIVAKQMTRFTAAILVGKKLLDFGKFLSSAGKWMGILTIGGVALTGAMAALAFTTGNLVVAALTSVGSAMGVTAGAAAGLLAPAIITAKIAFKQLGDAAKDYLKKFEEADKAFTTMIGQRMGPMLDAFQELKTTITDTFTATLEPSFANLGNLMNGLRPQMNDMARVLGQLGNELTRSLSSPNTMAAFDKMFAASQRFVGSFLGESGLSGITNGLINFAATAADTFAGAGKSINESLLRAGDWLRSIGPAQMKLVFATLQQQFRNVMDVVKPIFTTLRQLAAISAPALAPGFQAIGKAISDATPAALRMAETIMPALGQVMANLAPLIPALVQAFTPWSQILAVIAPPLATIVTTLAPFAPLVLAGVLAVKAITAGLAVYNTVMLAGTVATKGAAVAARLFSVALMANPIGIVIAGLVAIGAALWAFFTKTETGRKIWNTLWTGIKQVAGEVWEWLKGALQTVGEKISWLWNNIAVPAFEGIKAAITGFWSAVQVVWEALTSALQWVGDKISWLWNNIAVPAFEGIKSAAQTMWGGVKTVWDTFTGALDTVGQKFDAFKNKIVEIFDAVKRKVTETWESIKDIVGTIGDVIGNIGGVVINTLGLGGDDGGTGRAFFNSGGDDGDGGAPGFARGGRVWGAGTATSDSIPAMLSHGEHVLTAADVAAMGGQANVYAFRGMLHMAGGGAVLPPNPKLPEGGLQGNSILLGRLLGQMFPQLQVIGGFREDRLVDHPSGRALDVMIPNPTTPTGVAIGNAVMGFVMKNAAKLGVDYTIWRQTYRSSSGASNVMEDQGSPTQNHMDHVHITTNPGGPADFSIPKGLSLPPGFKFGPNNRAVPVVGGSAAAAVGGSTGASSAGGASVSSTSSLGSSSSAASLGGSYSASDVTYDDDGNAMVYRVATDNELESSGNKVKTAGRSVREGEQAITDRTNARDRAQARLDEVRANPKAKASQIRSAEDALERAERELTDATNDLADKRQKLADVTADDEELRTQGKQVKAKSERYSAESGAVSGSASSPGGRGDFSDVGRTLVSGLFESIGLDGSLFANPLEWPSVKSALAGVNFFGGMLSTLGAPADATTVSGGGFAAGAADAVGLGGMLSAIPRPSQMMSGSPQLAPGTLNPFVPGGSVAPSAPAVNGGSGAAPVDNSININGNVGMDPGAVQTKIRTEQNARTRTTVMR